MKRFAVVAALMAFFLSFFAAAPAQAGTLPVGQVANSATSSASVRAYDNRANANRTGTSLCRGTYKNVAPAKNSGFGWDADCLNMYSGSTKVTGNVVIKSRLTGKVTYRINIGCTTNRVQVAVHGMETATVSNARKCVWV
jgi:hypothetical protein